MLKGLSGSGWHMCSLMMRMIYDGFLHKTASMGSPGVDQMRWLAPFRPGDDLTLDVEVVEARVSQSRPTLGIVKFKFSTRNAKGQTISEMITPIMIGVREPASGN
jgi:acyl dehydratase